MDRVLLQESTLSPFPKRPPPRRPKLSRPTLTFVTRALLQCWLRHGKEPFDVIASPRNSHYSGGVVACPITNATHPLLIELSKIALEEYNDENNQDPPFEFDELVISTQAFCNGRLYCITFIAKRSSNTSSTIFQAIVGRSFNGLTKVLSCAVVPSKPWKVESFGLGCLL
ncbi:hypothetical protein QL285_027397 [Trifolium repens]|nr:hypothetical protein QL285_027397 [Trifolium repens]